MGEGEMYTTCSKFLDKSQHPVGEAVGGRGEYNTHKKRGFQWIF